MEGQPDGDSVNFKSGIINLDVQEAQEPILGLVKNHPSLGFNLKTQNNSTSEMFVGNDQLMLSQTRCNGSLEHLMQRSGCSEG